MALSPPSEVNAATPTPHSHILKLGCIVFWDIENIAIPARFRGDEVVRCLTNFITDPNYSIPQTSGAPAYYVPNQRRLQDSGVLMADCSNGKANAADMAIVTEIMKLTRFGYETVVIHGRNIKDTFLNCANETYMWDDILKLGVTAKVTEPAQVGTSTPKSNPIKSYDVLLDAIHALQESLPSGIVTLSSIKNLIDDAACQDEGYASLGQYVVAAWEARGLGVLLLLRPR
ncbi:hypothetical protein BC829DRAFT_449554 [Chytridium lagenaria]|nr:hypothetical protein BC829DRAFT_449554 [Chytridium lagenaria]